MFTVRNKNLTKETHATTPVQIERQYLKNNKKILFPGITPSAALATGSAVVARGDSACDRF